MTSETSNKELSGAEKRPLERPVSNGYGVDMTDHMAAEYRYEQAQQHA